MDWQTDWEKRDIPEDEWPIEHGNDVCVVTRCERRTPEKNRPGLGTFYCRVYDSDGNLIGGIKIGFDTEQGDEGIAYDHPNIWGVTGRTKGNLGYLQYDHPRVPSRYTISVFDRVVLSNVRLDLGNEYVRGGAMPGTWRPINQPGVYSYDIDFQLLS